MCLRSRLVEVGCATRAPSDTTSRNDAVFSLKAIPGGLSGRASKKIKYQKQFRWVLCEGEAAKQIKLKT